MLPSFFPSRKIDAGNGGILQLTRRPPEDCHSNPQKVTDKDCREVKGPEEEDQRTNY
jgi:hypothetical protein